jgi:predicted phosphodiesterase
MLPVLRSIACAPNAPERKTNSAAGRTRKRSKARQGFAAPRNFSGLMLRAVSLLALALMVLAGCASRSPRPRSITGKFDFALIGDVPYTAEQITNSYPKLLRALDHERLAFVVHAGDIKAAATPCDDSILKDRLIEFQRVGHPLIYVFGDNEWSDCGGKTNGTVSFDPEERLAKLRELFTHGDESLGRRTIRLTRQSDDSEFGRFRENVRWTRGDVLFVGLNVPGATNNFGRPEFEERNRANLAWMQEAFDLARRAERRAILFVMQANPFPERGSTNRIHPGFRPMIELLQRETVAFGRPVVLVHGDSHYFRIDKPLVHPGSRRRIENFTRVETFGNPDVHWIRGNVNPRSRDVFSFRPEIVPGNVVKHEAE